MTTNTDSLDVAPIPVADAPGTAKPRPKRRQVPPRPPCRNVVTKDHASQQPFEWSRNIGILSIHVLPLGVLLVGFSWTAFWAAIAFYVIRMFTLTGFYHRYFSHKTFKASRPVQFLMAFAGCMCVQRGPLWWSAHHRHHHAHADHDDDIHSPVKHGFFRAHMGWFLTNAGEKTNVALVKDLARYPEIRWIEKFFWVPVLVFAGWTALLGALAQHFAPQLGTNAAQMFIWGFGVSTVMLYHGTYTINSLAHQFGSRRFVTEDTSRNNFWLALLTLGEGWHNNHHHYQAATRQGFYWWEVDLTFYGLWVLSRLGVIRDLQAVPAQVLETNRVG